GKLLYRDILRRDPGEFGEFLRAKRPKRLPTVLSTLSFTGIRWSCYRRRTGQASQEHDDVHRAIRSDRSSNVYPLGADFPDPGPVFDGEAGVWSPQEWAADSTTPQREPPGRRQRLRKDDGTSGNRSGDARSRSARGTIA